MSGMKGLVGRCKPAKTWTPWPEWFIDSGVARPGPTRACALPSTFPALPSAISFEFCDSMMDQTEINCSANDHKSVTNIIATI